MKVIKRDGREVDFDVEKIIVAISKANDDIKEQDKIKNVKEIEVIAEEIETEVSASGVTPSVEDIQDLVIEGIQKRSYYKLARSYTAYMENHKLRREVNTTDAQMLSLIECNNEEVKQENSNKNPTINSTQRDYMAGEASKDLSRRYLLPEDVIKAHDEGIIHFHDMDYYAQREHNCCLVNLEDMLQNGTVISETRIDRPKMFSTACNIATQIAAQVASSQYGGQTMSIAHLVPFVQASRDLFDKHARRELDTANVEYSEEAIHSIVEERVYRDVKKGVKLIQYQVLTLMTTNGQTPFITINLDITEVPEEQRDDAAMVIKEVLEQRIRGVKNEKGVWITPAFPKLIYVLDECNVREGSKYYWLTELAAKCTAKRMVPDYVSAKVMKELKVDFTGGGAVYPPMGCRSFLTPCRVENNVANAGNFKEDKGKYYGRFNQGVVTINLVDVALSSGKDKEQFWQILDERLELCHRALRCRHERLLGTPSDVAPILWQHGALARLKKGEVIDQLLYGGYSTISLGYAGLYEMCFYMTGESHTTDGEPKEFALAVMQRMNDKCAEWKSKENIDYSVYGTPLESTTYKFAKCLRKRFGRIPEVTDHNYVTNSYHVCVREEIDAFDKLWFEAPFQRLSPGGAISYVEVPNLQNNITAVIGVIQFIYDNIMYAELNSKSDYCMCCNYDGEIKIIEEDGKLLWECPVCGNRNQSMMSVARRTCGYIGSQFWNQGRTQEIKDRVMHL